MPNILAAIREWWNMPPARQRILNALSASEWRRGYNVREAARIGGIARFYMLMAEMEDAGLVMSQPDVGPIPAVRGNRRGRIYRKL